MKPLTLGAVALTASLLYLLFWPTGMEPRNWTPPPAPALEGAYAPNDKLKAIQSLVKDVGHGPAGIYVDAFGRVVAGYSDGRLILLYDQGASYIELANTGGRPLGITAGPKGGLLIADAKKGMQLLWRGIHPLLNAEKDQRPAYANGAAFSKQDWQHIYFTYSSGKFGIGQGHKELLEHGANGQLLQYNPNSEKTQILLDELHFPSGVAVGPDGAYVLVSESSEYRVLRYWLKGQKAGTHDIFIDNLPGFPGQLSFNGRDRFWLALPTIRDRYLDELLPGSGFLRHLLARLPDIFLRRTNNHAFVIGLGLDGTVVANLQHSGEGAYAPITSVVESGPWLYFGSSRMSAIGRLPVQQAFADAPDPPPGWETVPTAIEQPNPLDLRERGEAGPRDEDHRRLR